MTSTVEFLDLVKARNGLPSDYALAPVLGITRSQVSRLRNRKDYFSDSTALRVAELLDVDPLSVVSVAHAERAKSDAERNFWAGMARRAFGLAGAVVLGLSAVPPLPAQAQEAGNAVYYVKRRRSIPRAALPFLLGQF